MTHNNTRTYTSNAHSNGGAVHLVVTGHVSPHLTILMHIHPLEVLQTSGDHILHALFLF